jgi:hypothetical protein
MDRTEPTVQIKALSLIDDAVNIYTASMPHFEVGKTWIVAFCAHAGLELKLTEHGADLAHGQLLFHQQYYLLSLNFITEDIWITSMAGAQNTGISDLYTHLKRHFVTN